MVLPNLTQLQQAQTKNIKFIMSYENYTAIQDSPEFSIEDIQHQLRQEISLVEAIDIQEYALQESTQPRIDIKTFTEVPEHGGSLREAIQRFKDNPNTPLPRCLKNLGFTSTHELVERLEDPDRKPTIRELKEAEKRKSESDKKSTLPNKVLTIKDDEPKKEALIGPVRGSIIVSAESKTDPIVDTSAGQVGSEMIIGQINKISTETIEAFTAIHRPITKKNPGIKVTSKPRTPRETATELFQIVAIPEAIKVPILRPSSSNNEAISLAVDTIDSPQEEISFDIENPSTEQDYTVKYSTPELIDSFEDQITLPVISTDAPDVKGSLDEGLDVIIVPGSTTTIQKTNIETIDLASNEVAMPIQLPVELNKYIESLEKDKAEQAKIVLQILVEALGLSQTVLDSGSEISQSDILRIEESFVELLELLNLDFQDETVKHLMRDLFSPEMTAEILEDQKLSIDKLNFLGTREYKISVSSLLTRISKMIQRKLETHIKIGRYALSASMINI